MINLILDSFKNLDNSAKIIMKKGIKVCYLFGFIALIILITYTLAFSSPTIFKIGFLLFKFSIIFYVEFIICGFAVDKIKKELI